MLAVTRSYLTYRLSVPVTHLTQQYIPLCFHTKLAPFPQQAKRMLSTRSRPRCSQLARLRLRCRKSWLVAAATTQMLVSYNRSLLRCTQHPSAPPPGAATCSCLMLVVHVVSGRQFDVFVLATHFALVLIVSVVVLHLLVPPACACLQ